jgi:exodeoxyribonuclease VII large subunit
VRATLEAEEQLQDLWVAGEVSNLSQPRSGHLYFTLKDSEAALRCVMWKPQVLRLGRLPQPGDAVEVHGSISVYEAGGQYQLYADRLRPTGAGLLYQQFLQLKEALEAEGLFDPERKREIPTWPGRIGVVTSPTGAALQDILNTLQRRFPLPEVVLAPTLVQGEGAPAGIIRALGRLNQEARPDVILLARGGGSLEDLWAFNDEGVVRAVVASDAPVITGVGHETDFTLADFAADLRAPTPTAAAELATPDRGELLDQLAETQARLERAAGTLLREWQLDLEARRTGLQRASPRARVQDGRQRLDEADRRARTALLHFLQIQRARLEGQGQRLDALSPGAVLSRGYAVVRRPDGEVIRRAGQVLPGDPLQVRVQEGQFGVQVTQAEEASDG